MIRVLCRTLLHLFFRTVHIHDVERLPATGPVLVVSNHHSGLVDPAVLIATLPRSPRFLAKAALWRWQYLPLRPFLFIAGAIPVHRRKDGGGDNTDTFAATRAALEKGELIALFGEGVSHDEPGLLDVKTGAARIALGADGPLSIVPIGLIYDDRARYRSHVSAAVGWPIEVVGRPGGDEDRDAVTGLTDRITAALADVAPSWESWEEHDDAKVAARLTAANDDEVEYGAVVTRLNRKIDDRDAGMEAVRTAVRAFREEVDRLGLDIDDLMEQGDAELGSIEKHTRVMSMIWWPLVTLGRLLNVVPYTVIRLGASRMDLNIRATFKILLGLFVYPGWWIVLWAIGAALWSGSVGLALAFGAAILGYLSAQVASRLRYAARERDLRHPLRSADRSDLVARRAYVVAATRRELSGSP